MKSIRTQVLLLSALSLALFALTGSSTRAQGPRLEKKLAADSLVFTVKLDPKTVPTAGKSFDVTVHVPVHHPWHVYSSTMKQGEDGGLEPLTLSVPQELAKFFTIEKIREKGKYKESFDENFNQNVRAYYDPFDVVVTVRVKAASKTKIPFSLLLHYQTCNENSCLPARNFLIPMTMLGQKPIELMIAEGTVDSTTDKAEATPDTNSKSASISAATPAPPAATPKSNSNDVTGGGDTNGKAPQKAFGLHYLVVALLAGLGALVTPCVYPMVPITVSFFTKRNAGSRKEAVKDALLYGFGIIFTFVAIGFILSLLLRGSGGIGGFAASPVTNILVALLYLAFAMNLFGLFEIGVPSSVLSKLNSTAQHSKNRAVSVILMGFVFSLTSFTCSVPFVGSAFADFMHGSFITPILGMTVFASVFALPFIVLALVPSLVKSMPRSGGWLNSVKVVMGFLEVAIALRYIGNADVVLGWSVFSRDLIIAAWVAIAIITTFYLLGRFQLSHDSPVEHIGALRVMLAVIALSVGVYLYTGFHGKSLGQIDGFLPPSDESLQASVTPTAAGIGSSGVAASTEMVWHNRYNEALAEAKRTGKNIFVDFTGYSCTNCRIMESTVFSRPDVKDIFKNMVLARLYIDNGSPLNDSNRTMEETRFNTIALPYYVILSPDDKPLSIFPDGYTRDVDAFKAFLRLERRNAVEPTVAMVGR